MNTFDDALDLLCGILMPAALFLCGLYFLVKLRAFFLLHPIKLLKSAFSSGNNSSIRAVTLALAGTLGVGNISGVATAITAGGAGAVFWMEVSAVFATAVKYAETSLAVTFRRRDRQRFYGGAPYYIRDGIPRSSHICAKYAAATASIFAVLCIINALTTGNLVQIKAAAEANEFMPPLLTGIIFAALCTPVIIGGWGRISGMTLKLIPLLAAVFIAVSIGILSFNLDLIPTILAKIWRGAFDTQAVAGGITGWSMSAAVRYGVTRGLLSNEAGCGTSPTAHAAAEAKSPELQGCFGVIEVAVDTVLMCTLTAVVIIASGMDGDSIPLALDAYEYFGGRLTRWIIAASVDLFAYATVICQWFYAAESIRFLSRDNKKRQRLMTAAIMPLYIAAIVAGAVIDAPLMWAAADVCIAVMTVVNVTCVFILRKFVHKPEL